MGKDIVRMGVKAIYGIDPPDDEALDAIAVGHCHLLKTAEVTTLKGG